MDLSTTVTNGLWAALVASGLGILLATPHRYLIPSFVCGFTGYFVRELCTGWGVGRNWSTLIASALVALAASAFVRGRRASPVLLICGVIPLGAVVAMYNTLSGLMRLSSAKGDVLNDASNEFISNLAKAFTTTLAIAVGIGAGMAIVRLFKREDEAGEV